MNRALLLAVLLIVGCGVTPIDVRKAEEFCSGHGGWEWFSYLNEMRCKDGSIAKLHDYKLSVEEVQSE